MAVQGIGPKEAQFQAFQALNQKSDEVKKQDKAEDKSLTAKLNAPQEKNEDAGKMFKLSVEKEQGKGLNLNMLG